MGKLVATKTEAVDLPCLYIGSKYVQGSGNSTLIHYAPQPNGAFNVDANKGHAFGIFMALIGALRASRYGAS